VKRWISGEEAMKRYGLEVAELGGLCRDGRLVAYARETLQPIRNEVFIFNRFRRNAYSSCDEGRGDFESYANLIGKMLFVEQEIQAVTGGTPPQGEAPVENAPDAARQGKIMLNVPASLWAGKKPEAAMAAIKVGGYDDIDLIAYILVEKMKVPKLAAGRLLFTPLDGEEMEDSTYSRKITTALGKIKSLYNLTFFN
jgi:hypothetical protein